MGRRPAGGAGAVEVTTAAQHLLEAERYRWSDMNAHSASAGACQGTCPPAKSCTSCKHQHAHRQLQACRHELEKLVQTHLASQGGAAGAPGGGGAGAAKLSKGAKKNHKKKKARKAAAAGPPGAGGSDSD